MARSIYRKPEIQSKMMAIYDQKLSAWPVPYESLHITTRYGSTHAIACGPADGYPLILIPGLGVTATMWKPNIAALSQDFRCYALDVIGDYGKSVLDHPYRYLKKGKDYSLWLCDVYAGLSIQCAHVMGASNGGYAAIQHAVHAPEQIKRLVLLAPSGLNITLSKILPKILHYLLFPTDANRERLIKWFLGGNPSVHGALYTQMWLATQGLPKVPIPILIQGRTFERILSPTLFILGEKDPAISSPVGVRRIHEFMHTAQIIVVPEVGHVLNYEAPDIVEQSILSFLKE